MDCEFCKKKFKTKQTLLTHQQSTKSCLLIQGKLYDEENSQYECGSCNKKFSLNHVLERHEKVCKVKKQEEFNIIEKQLEDYKRIKEENKKLRAEIKQQRQYEKEIYEKDLEIERLKTEIRIKNENKEEFNKIIEKNNNDKLTMFKDVVNKSNKIINNNNTKNTVNNIYVQQQLDRLVPINELPSLIASNSSLKSTLKYSDSLDDFYSLCAKESTKCFLANDSSREIVSGRKVGEDNKVEYIKGKMQNLIGDYIVNEELYDKITKEKEIVDKKLLEDNDYEPTNDEIISGQVLYQLHYKISDAINHQNKLKDKDVLSSISKKAMSIMPKLKNKDDNGSSNE
jgi:hypothetical protein